MSTEITYEKLLYAAPIVNSIRHKWGFRGFKDPLGWAEYDGKFTYLSREGTSAVILCANYSRLVEIQPHLFKGSHRDIASATRQYLFSYISFEIDFERSEYKRNLREVNRKIKEAERSLLTLIKRRDAMVESPSYNKYKSIERKKLSNAGH